jgi:sensor histidine kinase YesM
MENSSPLDSSRKPGRAWLSTVYTAALSVGIAVFLWLLQTGSSFPAILGVSLCIGLSINSMFMLFRERCEQFAHPLVVAMLLTGTGLGIGLLLGGALVLGVPLYFFSDNYATIIIGVFFGIVGFAIIGSRERLADAREEVANLRAERLAREREILETELKLLQAQIEPHFLFNTLSNVVGLVRSDPEAAEKTLLNLSTLLRSSLRRTRAEAVSLGEELEIVRAYLAIQSLRMQDRLEYTIDVADDPALLNWPLPPLIIQPLVENAIRHGVDPAEGGGTVSIAASRDNTGLNIVVADTGVGVREAGSGGEGTGLSNVRSRLRGLYGEGAGLDFRDNTPSGVRVEIRIPEKSP